MVPWQDGQLHLRGTSKQQNQKIVVFVNSTKYLDSGFSLPLISYVAFGLFIPLYLPQFLQIANRNNDIGWQQRCYNMLGMKIAFNSVASLITIWIMTISGDKNNKKPHQKKQMNKNPYRLSYFNLWHVFIISDQCLRALV